MSILKKKYEDEIAPALQKRFAFENKFLVPKLEKIIVHMGIAEITKDKNAIQDCEQELALITGQVPIRTHARVSISNFKLREGQVLGLKVTLRGRRMYDFMYKFCHLISPRIRDFRGFKRKGDGSGNYSVGLNDHQIFPELNLDKVKRSQGMHITFVTSARNDDECLTLLDEMSFPFKKNKGD